MADYLSQTVIQPLFPSHLLTEEDLDFFSAFHIEAEKGRSGETYYLFADEWCSSGVLYNEETGEETEYEEDDLIHRFQEIIRRSEGTLPWVSMEKAYTCSKMRPDGFGGSAIFITADDMKHVSTGYWLEEQIDKLEGSTPDPVPTVAVVMEGGLVQSIVSDSPEKLPPMKMIIIDYDTDGANEEDLVSVPQGKDRKETEAFAGIWSIGQTGIDLAAVVQQLEEESQQGPDCQETLVKCFMCGNMVPRRTANVFYEKDNLGHFIGDCCWDERLRN